MAEEMTREMLHKTNEYEVWQPTDKATKEEVLKWIEDKSEENLEKIILQYHFFIKGIVGRLCKQYGDMNLYKDFIQEAQIPLIKTYWDFDTTKEADFTTILKIRIEGYIQQMYNDNYRTVATPKHAFKEKKITSMSILMNDYIDINEYEEAISDSDIGIKTDDLSYEVEYDDTNEIQQILKTFLSDKQFFIISHSYGFNMKKKKSSTEISKYFNCTRQPIEREIKKIEQLIAENKNKFMGEC